MARSKNGLRDFGPGGDKRPEFGPSYVLLPGQGAVTNYTLYISLSRAWRTLDGRCLTGA